VRYGENARALLSGVTVSVLSEPSIVMSVSVCVYVRDHVSGTTHPIFTRRFER